MCVAKLRVLFLATHLSSRDARFLKLRASMSARGWCVGAAAPAFHSETPPDGVYVAVPDSLDVLLDQAANYRAISRPAAYLRAARRRHKLVAEAVRFGPDIIIAFDPETLPTAVEAKRRTGARLIYDAHEFHADQLPGPESEARSAWVERAQARYFRALDGFVTVSRGLAQRYSAYDDMPRHQFILRNFTDWTQSAAAGDRLRDQLALSPEHRILIYHGSFQVGRGLPLLAALSHQLPDPWHIVCVGEGVLTGHLKQNSSPDRLHILNPVPYNELPSMLQHADLGAILYEDISFSIRHALPNKFWEYTSLGVPVLVTDLPEIGALVREHRVGFRVSDSPSCQELASLLAGLTPSALKSASACAITLAGDNRWADAMEAFFSWIEMVASTAPRCAN